MKTKKEKSAVLLRPSDAGTAPTIQTVQLQTKPITNKQMRPNNHGNGQTTMTNNSNRRKTS